MDKAEKVVTGNAILLRRVQRDRMPLDMMWLQRYSELKQTAETNKVEFAGPKDPYAAAQDFIHRLKLWNAKGFGCGQNIDILINGLNAAFPAPVAVH